MFKHGKFAAALILGVLAGPIGSESASAQTLKKKPPARSWSWKTGDVVYQLITVAKRPKFQVQGLSFESKIRYKLLSRLTMRVSPLDGSLTIKQRVETTKLEEADELSQAVLSKMLRDLTGKTISIRINASGDISRIEGVPEPAAATVNNGLDFRGVMLTSLIDRDGWKELSKATIFTPSVPLVENASWKENVTHSWGPLGSWQGNMEYRYAGANKGLEEIPYRLLLRYQKPAAANNNLPFQIANPMFRTKKAEGVLLYDAKKSRLHSMNETFHVAGQLSVKIAGQSLPMQIDEEQRFQLELFDKKPAADKR